MVCFELGGEGLTHKVAERTSRGEVDDASADRRVQRKGV